VILRHVGRFPTKTNLHVVFRQLPCTVQLDFRLLDSERRLFVGETSQYLTRLNGLPFLYADLDDLTRLESWYIRLFDKGNQHRSDRDLVSM